MIIASKARLTVSRCSRGHGSKVLSLLGLRVVQIQVLILGLGFTCWAVSVGSRAQD